MNQNKLLWTENSWLIFMMNWDRYSPLPPREYNYAMWKERRTSNFWFSFHSQLKIIKMFLHQYLAVSLTLAMKMVIVLLVLNTKTYMMVFFPHNNPERVASACLLSCFVVGRKLFLCCWFFIVTKFLILNTSGLVWLITSFTINS